jgi:hypothetical protein
MNASAQVTAQTAATLNQACRLSASVELGLPETNPKNLRLPWAPNLVKAFRCGREAQREERNGFPYTAAHKSQIRI